MLLGRARNGFGWSTASAVPFRWFCEGHGFKPCRFGSEHARALAPEVYD